MVGIQMKKTSIVLNKPIYCGLTILDNSKMLMYGFHYEFIKQRYGSDATLLFTDTDSLCYHVKTEDVYQDMFERKEEFDFSDYPKDSQFHDPTNKQEGDRENERRDGIGTHRGVRWVAFQNVLTQDLGVRKQAS